MEHQEALISLAVIAMEMAMIQITPPTKASEDGDRQLEAEFALDMPLRALVDDAIAAGWERTEVFTALKSLVDHQRNAYGEDPDPADDPNWITASASII
jgi:hypothetical protein